MANTSAALSAAPVTETQPTEHKPARTIAPAPVIIDIGKRKRSQVKKLRKGRGKLLDRVQDVLADMTTEGTITANQPVIVVVREKQKRGGGLKLF